MSDFIQDYFINPIIMRTGYNPINTIAYASIALLALFFIYKYFKKESIPINNYFILSLFSFILFGSLKRVITDATDKIYFSNFINDFYSYNFFNVTPFIYVFVAFLFLSFTIIEHKLKIKNLAIATGLLLSFLHAFILLPYFTNYIAFFAILIIAIVPFLISRMLFKSLFPRIVVLAHSLDGAATFIATEFLNYGEQHVLSNFIGIQFGFISFFIVKILISFAFAYILEKENMLDFDKNFLYVIAISAGLGPGLRDILRILVGV